jgi:hypothetical protein
MQSEQSPEEVAGFILLPSHVISTVDGAGKASVQPAMGDYSNRLTVRQLMDLIAYIRAPARGKLSSTRDANP